MRDRRTPKQNPVPFQVRDYIGAAARQTARPGNPLVADGVQMHPSVGRAVGPGGHSHVDRRIRRAENYGCFAPSVVGGVTDDTVTGGCGRDCQIAVSDFVHDSLVHGKAIVRNRDRGVIQYGDARVAAGVANPGGAGSILETYICCKATDWQADTVPAVHGTA